MVSVVSNRTMAGALLGLGLWLLAGVAQAGAPFEVWFPVDGNINTTLDDAAVARSVRWPEGLDPQFLYYRRPTGFGDFEVLTRSLNDNELTEFDVREAINRAVETWNDALDDFQFPPPIAADLWAPHPNSPPWWEYHPRNSALDGYNLITFLDDETFPGDVTGGQIAATLLTFFHRDFSLEDILAGYPEVDPDLLNSLHFGDTDVTRVALDFDGDDQLDLFFPEIRNYKQGELIDVDIIFATTLTYYDWPEDPDDIPVNMEPFVAGSPDIQATMMTQLGLAQGIGLTYIIDSVMYPFTEGPSSPFPTNPYRKRELAFDDIMTARLTHNPNWLDPNFGAIAGSVLEGAVVDGDAIDVDDDGEVTQPVDEENELDAYIVQKPVFLGVRPVQLAESAVLAGGNTGRVDPEYTQHPDNIEAESVLGDANDGTYRMIAQVLTGRELVIQRGEGDDDLFFPIDIEGDEEPDEIEGGITLEDDGVVDTVSRLNSAYLFPGLPSHDDNGTTLSYALYLDEDGEYPLNPVHDFFLEEEDYPPEFYGGPMLTITQGNGQAPVFFNRADREFENEYITVDVDLIGRFALSINDGQALLSGFRNGPESFVSVTSPLGQFSNKFTAIGNVVQSMLISDADKRATGVFSRNNDFELRITIRETENGGESGINDGVEVTYSLTNPTFTPRVYSLRQVLDTLLFGSENPIYVLDYEGTQEVLDESIALTGDEIPTNVIYQTSIADPVFRGYINLRGAGTVTPDTVIIDRLSALENDGKARGTDLRGPDAGALDTGVALLWEGIEVPGQETVNLSFNIGFLPPGELRDSWVPFPDGDVTIGDLTGFEDDPGRVALVHVTQGEITDNIDIITNTGEEIEGVAQVSPEEGYASGPLRFRRARNGGFPDDDFVTMHGALGDIDNDGDLDCFVANFGGGADLVASRINRLYLNEQRVLPDGTIEYYFRDVTLGEDGIKGTPDDRFDRIVAENSVGVNMADFDGDGDIDLFVTNINGPNRFYENLGPDPDKIGFFADISAEVLPGLLNRGWDEQDPSGWDFPHRAAVGDIDSDGDLDLIISQRIPFFDDTQTNAWADIAPRDEDFPLGDQLMDSRADLFSEALLFAERVLVNQINQPNYSPYKRGFYFVDETLGSDERAGTLTSLVTQRVTLNSSINEGVALISFDSSELDRMPPVFPIMFNISDDGTINGVASPMAAAGAEPRLGPYVSSASLDLFSVRNLSEDILYVSGLIPLTLDVEEGEGIVTAGLRSALTGLTFDGGHQAYFRNVDMWSMEEGLLGADQVDDGYFACFNYNLDYGVATGTTQFDMLPFDQAAIGEGDPPSPTVMPTAGGLFAIEVDPTNPSRLRHDAFPLLIGFPEGHDGDWNFQNEPPFERDLASNVSRVGWAAYIADFQNRSAPRPFIAADNEDGLGGPPYTSNYTDEFGDYSAHGVARGFGTSEAGGIGGIAVQYLQNYPGIYTGLADSEEVEYYPELAVEPSEGAESVQAGEPFGVAVADFDWDGDYDFFLANTTVPGITINPSTVIIGGNPAPNQLFLNDGFARFTEMSDALLPNNELISMHTVSGDLDNDGDIDLVVFNANDGNEIFFNTIFNKPPDLAKTNDATLFYETTRLFLPDLSGSVLAPPAPIDSSFSGLSIRTTVGDINHDGRPDMVIAEGGQYSADGDFTRVLLNKGQPIGDSVPVFKPGDATFPAPHVDMWNHNFLADPLPLVGFMGEQFETSDVALGDVDNDGDLDMFIASVGSGTRLYLNQDSDIQLFNSAPDDDALGDAIFDPGPGFPVLEDPDGGDLLGVVLKQQNRRIKLADLNGDGLLDVVIANGLTNSGAPNALLLNQPGDPGTFIDVTETNLPTTEIGGVTMGIPDNTNDVGLADFDADGDIDILFVNESTAGAPYGFRLLLNDGNAMFEETEPGSLIPEFIGLKPYAIVLADFDNLGETTEDVNFNGVLDPGEDTNGNGILDWEDKGESDGICNASVDIFISVMNGPDLLLVNDPAQPGHFLAGESSSRLPDTEFGGGESRGCDAGDIDLDGDMDIVVAQYVGGVTRHVRVWRNGTRTFADGTVRQGYFTEISHEVPFSRANLHVSEIGDEPDDAFDFAGWATDVDLFDADLDGDLDMMITCLGRTGELAVMGAQDIFYCNRLIGDGFNAKPEGIIQTPGDPIVFSATPPAAELGETKQVRLIGGNFAPDQVTYLGGEGEDAQYERQPGVHVSFGQGIEVLEVDRKSGAVLDVVIRVKEDATLGPRRIAVQNMTSGGSTTTKMGIFTVYEELPDAIRNAVPDTVWTMY